MNLTIPGDRMITVAGYIDKTTGALIEQKAFVDNPTVIIGEEEIGCQSEQATHNTLMKRVFFFIIFEKFQMRFKFFFLENL